MSRLKVSESKGNTDARSIFDRLYTRLCLFANKYLNDPDASKDVVQEVFIKIWEKNPTFPNFDALKSFYYKSVKNSCLDYLKSKYCRVVKESLKADEVNLPGEGFFLTKVLLTDTYAELDAAIKKLPPKSQRIIWLSLKSYSNKEIAEELSISLNTVKTQKRIAYQKIRDGLDN